MKKSNVKVGDGKAADNRNKAAAAANSKNDILVMVFENPEFGRVRTIVDKDGEPLFCGKDVCDILGYRQPHTAVHQHVRPHDVVKRHVGLTIGKKKDGSAIIQHRQVIFVTEIGLYNLVFGSKLDSAMRFKLWVTSVVLPQIRKTGGFIPLHEGESDEDACRNAEEILRRTLEEKEQLIARQEKLIHDQVVRIQKAAEEIVDLEHDIDRLLPKALYTDNVLDSISCYTTTQVAKELGLTTQELNRALCALHVQYYQSGQYMLYADYAHRGFAKSRTHSSTGDGRHMETRTYLVWTERGREFIHRLKLPIYQLRDA